jgi:serine O-acetyltransferase
VTAVLANLGADTRRLREIKTRPFPWYVVESLLFENGYQAVVLHRIAHWFKRRRIPFFGPLFARISLFLTGVDIGPGAEIGPGLWISHGVGLVIGGNARIGRDATLLHGVTIGAPGRGRQAEMPTVGDSVFIGAGAKLIGAIRIGDRVFVGVNVVVTRDVPDDSLVLLRGEPEIRPLRHDDAPAGRQLSTRTDEPSVTSRPSGA